MNHIVQTFQDVYRELNKHNIGDIGRLYSDDVMFTDPFHEIHGLTQLIKYFTHMYKNVKACSFEFTDVLINGNTAAIFWTMNLAHNKLNHGKHVSVTGSSLIRFDTKIVYHRDYFDAGALIYERVPLLGGIIRNIKARV